MFDIEKLASSILKKISEPIKRLADRVNHLEKKQDLFDPVVLDMAKYAGLLENFSKHIEMIHLFEKSNYLKEEDYQKLKDLILEVEKKLLNEDAIVDRVKAAIKPDLDAFRNHLNEMFDLVKSIEPAPVIDYEKLKPPELPDIEGLIADAVASEVAALPKAMGIEEVSVVLEAMVDKAVAKIELPETPELPDIEAMVNEATAKEVAALPKVPSIEDVECFIEKSIKEQVANIELPKAPELPDIEGMIATGIAAEVASLPKPKDGNSITVDDVKPFIEELLGKLVDAIPPAKDGAGLAGGVIGRDGHLILTLSNGNTINLGPVVGKDVDMTEVERMVAEKVAAIPRPKDGVDGLGFEDLSVEYDGKRTFTLKFERGDKSKSYSFKTPQQIYVGVYENGKQYEIGDTVTWAGSQWHCKKDTTAKPNESDDWTLSVKRGRDGKEVFTLPRDPNKPVNKKD